MAKKPRAIGWTRLAIILSVVWLFAGGDFLLNVEHANSIAFGKSEYARCLGTPMTTSFKKINACANKIPKNVERHDKDNLVGVVIVTVLALPFFWAIYFGLIGLARWVKHGFETEEQR